MEARANRLRICSLRTKKIHRSQVAHSGIDEVVVPAQPEGKERVGHPRRADVTPQLVWELRDRGLSFRQIARKLDAGYGTVRKACHEVPRPLEPSENPAWSNLLTSLLAGFQ